MAGQDMLTDQLPEAPSRPGRAPGSGPLGMFRRLSERTPLRTKLITAVLLLVIMALAAISIASVYMLRGYVTTQHDAQLTSVFNQLESNPGTLNREVAPGEANTIQGSVVGLQLPGHQLGWVTLGFPNGNTFKLSGPLPALPTGTGWAGNSNSPVLVTMPSQSGVVDTWRVMAYSITNFQVTSTQTETVTLVIATDLGNINALTTRLIVFDLIVGAAIVVVLAAAGVAVVRTNLRPLDDIELTAGQIAAGHLDHRVPERDPRTEVGSLGRSLNAMLTQIETAFRAQQQSEQAAHESEEKMRRFIADASHELRTPLTTIRGFAAHYRQRGGAGVQPPSAAAGSPAGSRTEAAVPATADATPASPGALSPEELDHLMGRVEAEATRMGVLVEDLLTLARLDQQRPLAKAPVDLLSLAADAVQDARIVSPGRPIDLVVAPGTAFLVDGDEARLRQVLGNLVNNAITHTPDGTPVRVKIAAGTLPAHPSDDGRPEQGEPGEPDIWAVDTGVAPLPPGTAGEQPAVVLDVEDDGPGMTAEQAHRVFERFYRADAARNRASGGTGLGLAIVAGLVAAHGGTVSVRTRPGQGADFQVKLPLSPDALVADEADDDELTD